MLIAYSSSSFLMGNIYACFIRPFSLAEAHLAARRKARYEARNIRMREMEKKQKAEMETANSAGHATSSSIMSSSTPGGNLTTSNSNSNITNNHHDRDVRLRGRGGGGNEVSGSRGFPSTDRSRRSSTDSSEDGFNLNVRELKNEKKELEEKFRKAMVANT